MTRSIRQVNPASQYWSQFTPEWINEDIPYSTRFEDTYYTKSDGRGETDHVFINGNHLPRRWPNNSSFTIAELGFGTGLNFLQTVFRWNGLKSPGASLNFFSFEQYPMPTDAMAHALSHWPQLGELAHRLCSSWQVDGGIFDWQFARDIQLRVIFGDANLTLPNTELLADAWYLDGFSPAKNPQLWNLNLMQQVHSATKSGGTFATYSVAGMVRRNLQAAGFEISRNRGYGTKREMLSGYRM